THGKQRRRDQARRDRRRRQQRATGPESAPSLPQVEPEPPAVEAGPPTTTDPPVTSPSASEGQPPAQIPELSWGPPCDRPGRYVVFLPTPRSPHQHFCSCRCRQP